MNTTNTSLNVSPDLVSILFKQALDAQLADNLHKAKYIYQQILNIEPYHSDSLYNLGLIALQTGELSVAAEKLGQVADLTPSADVYSLLGLALMSAQQDSEAILAYQKAIALNPDEYMAHNHLGVLFCRRHQYQQGLTYLQHAVAINPAEYSALNDLALCLMSQGRYQQAAVYFRRALETTDFSTITFNNLLLCLCFDEYAFPTTYLHEAATLDRLLTSQIQPYQQWPHAKYSKHNPLRVGLVSGDLNNHPVGYFLESLMTAVNPQKIHFFSYDTAQHEDDLTFRIKSYTKKWMNVADLNDEEIAGQIHRDGIHILIDLAGHTAHNKLPVFAYKPAPLQISWLGYFASTGMSFIDYFLADPISIPTQNKSHFTEKVWYLPESRLCFSKPATNIPQQISPLPALKNGFVTFGCFQTLGKINHKMMTLWADILHHCPNSKLLFKNHQLNDASLKKQLLDHFNTLHIDSSRIILQQGGTRGEYFKAYSLVDFMLDTFPYPGGTTTCEALWMGVPTLTLGGNTLLERQGMSMLSCVGLTEWIADNEIDYVKKAIDHAHHLDKLIQLRQHLRQQLQDSALANSSHFAIHFEAALLGMWQEKMG